MKEKVLAWIHENFNNTVTVEEYPLMPGGHLVRDTAGGEMLVYYDILTETVRYKIKP